MAAMRVLVVEDEALIAMLLEDMLMEWGATLIGPFGKLADAQAAAAGDNFDVALIDLNLHGESADGVARLLAQRRIPFAVVSGSADHHTGCGETLVLPKPFSFDDIAAALRRLEGAMGPRSG